MTIKNYARLTGLVYLSLILTGIYGLVFVPSALFDWQSPATTVANILAHEGTFKLGVLAITLCFTCYLALVLMLYRLFHTTSKAWPVALVALAVISIPSTFTITGKYIDVLSLVQGQPYLRGWSTEQLNAQVMSLLLSFNNSLLLFSIFWGAWLFPFGILIIKSRFIPSTIGYLLMLGAFSYIAQFVAKFYFAVEHIPWHVGLSSSIGEFAVCLWMIVFGVKTKEPT